MTNRTWRDARALYGPSTPADRAKYLAFYTLAAVADWTAYGLASLGCAVRRRHSWVPLVGVGGYTVAHYCARCYAMDEEMT